MSEESGETAKERRVHHASGWRAATVWMLGVLVRAWCRTLRVEIAAQDRATGLFSDEPVVVVLWHNRLFIVPWLLRVLRTARPVCALVSASRDGAVLARLFESIGIRTVRGSSSRFGREALHELIACQRMGQDTAVTPDGPRGPLYEMKPGALLAARRTRSPLMLFGIVYSRAWRTNSWDRFFIPWPFSRVVIRCERLDPFALGHGAEAVERLRARMVELNGNR